MVNGESGLCVHAGPRCWADAGLGIGEGLDMENGKLLASGFGFGFSCKRKWLGECLADFSLG